MYVTVRSRMRLIMDLIGPELSELFALEFAEIAESDFVYTITSTNIDHLVPNMVTVYMTVSLIMGQIWSYLPVNKEKLFDFLAHLSTMC